jgi:hypothetical protein
MLPLLRHVLQPIRWLAVLLLLAGCGHHDGQPTAATDTDPADAAHELIRDLRQNDLPAFWKRGLPAGEYAALDRRWRQRQARQPITDAQRADFDRFVRQLTEPGAKKALATRWQPTLARLDDQYGDQFPVLVAIGGGMLKKTAAITFALNSSQARALDALLAPLVSWAQHMPWSDARRSEQAIAIAVDTARSLQLTTLDQLRALDFTAAMRKASQLCVGAKRALTLYGLSLDTALDSARVSPVSQQGNSARVRIDYVLLGQPQHATVKMHRVDGRWYPDALPQFARGLRPPEESWWSPPQARDSDTTITREAGALPVQ